MNKRKLTKSTITKYKKVVDEWFVNKFNGAAAYRKFYKSVKSNETATVNFSKIKAFPEIEAYIESKHKKASENSHLSHEDILNEIEGFVMFDPSKIVNLKTVANKSERRVVDKEATKELKKRRPDSTRKKYKEEEYTWYEQKLVFTDFDELTDLQRRSIKSVKEGRFGIEIEFQSKEKYFEMLNKHKGFYEADNKQKAASINYDSLSAETLMKIWDARNGN